MAHQNEPNASTKSVLRALRLNFRELLPIGGLFLVAMLCWCIAEFSTVVFQAKIDGELRTVTSSDIAVSSRTMPAEIDRAKLRSTAEKYGARVTESVDFPYTLEIPKNPASAGTGSRFLTTEIRIVDGAYPLYGEVVSSGSLRDGAVASSEIFRAVGASGFEVSGKRIPVSGSLEKAPGLSSNPFSANQNILVPVALLPFETVTATGAGYRLDYEMNFAVSPENHPALRAELETRFGAAAVPGFRVREQRGEGGNFSDIATTLNDFLGSILYASALIALSSFVVAVSRFALERQKTVRTLLWMGLPESRLVRTSFGRLLRFFGGIGIVCIILFFLLPGISLGLATKGIAFLLLTVTIGCWILAEILLRDTRIFGNRRLRIRAWFVAGIFLMLAGYLWLSSGSYRPLAYSIGTIVLLERFSWGFFLLASKLFGTSEKFSKPRFFLLDALRSFRSAPALGKVSFSVFFLLSATLSAVFLFSLAFRDALRLTTDSPINTFAINLLPKDYETLSKWTPPEDFYSTMRARIVTIN
jgi:predicted lysophospholipase L1 biosynthesis ABC-type transport system permease subunit